MSQSTIDVEMSKRLKTSHDAFTAAIPIRDLSVLNMLENTSNALPSFTTTVDPSSHPSPFSVYFEFVQKR